MMACRPGAPSMTGVASVRSGVTVMPAMLRLDGSEVLAVVSMHQSLFSPDESERKRSEI